MSGRAKLRIAATTIATLLPLALLGGPPATAVGGDHPIPYEADSTQAVKTWRAVAPNGDTFYPEDPGEVQPMVDPIDRVMCSTGVQDHMVNSWEMDYVITDVVRLNCGTAETAGYNHIEFRHEQDWLNFMEDGVLYGAAWDDFMEFSVGSVLQGPSNYTSEGNGKLCFEAPIYIEEADGTTWLFYPNVIVSENNLIVITAYPGAVCGY